MAHIVIILIGLVLVKSAILRRDCFSHIAQHQYRGGWLLLVVIFSLYISQAMLVVYAPGASTLQIILLNLSHIGFIVAFLLNRHLPGAKLAAIGLVLNLVVMLSNGGLMPLTPSNAKFVIPKWYATVDIDAQIGGRPPSSKNVILLAEQTKLQPLADTIRIASPWGQEGVLSFGDLLMLTGIALFIFKDETSKRRGLGGLFPKASVTH